MQKNPVNWRGTPDTGSLQSIYKIGMRFMMLSTQKTNFIEVARDYFLIWHFILPLIHGRLFLCGMIAEALSFPAVTSLF